MYTPRYNKNHHEQSKRENRLMFTLDLDRRYTTGFKTTTQGVLQPANRPEGLGDLGVYLRNMLSEAGVTRENVADLLFPEEPPCPTA